MSCCVPWSICYLVLYCTYRVMVYLGSATRKVLLGAAQYLLSNTYWATVYLHSTTIKEQLCAVHYLILHTQENCCCVQWSIC